MKPQLFYGLLCRHECLRPTWRGLLLIGFFGAALLVAAVMKVHPFLAPTERVPAQALVVEGWVPDYVLEKTVVEFERGQYRKLYVMGGPIEQGGFLSGYKTYAELGAAILVKMGVNSSMIEAVPSPLVRRDRTYVSAVALRDRLQQQAAGITAINLISMGVHARRSHLLFQKAFDSDMRIGIIAVENRSYASERWWQSSDGVRAVVNEFIGYIYALLVFPFAEP